MINGLRTAAMHMQTALDLLDSVNAPAELGAHLDLTISKTRQLAEEMEAQSAASAIGQARSASLETLGD